MMMDCTECQPLLPEYALGQLTEAERQGVGAHLATGCPHCARVLREAEETWVLLADALPSAAVPERIEAVLRERVAQQRGQRDVKGESNDPSPASVVPASEGRITAGDGSIVNGIRNWPGFSPGEQENSLSHARRWSPLHWVLAASVLVAVTVGLVAWISRSERDDLSRPVILRAEEMERLQDDLESFHEFVNGPRLRLASLHERDRRNAVRGFVVWDHISRQIHFYAFDLPRLAEGRVYRIWLIPEGAAPEAAGALNPRADGTAGVVVDVPNEMGDVFRICVAEEAEGSPSDPETDPWLTSEIE